MIEIKDLRKTYQMGDTVVAALDGVNLRIDEGEFVAIMGPSGSGKSTLAQILGLLDVPSSGSYRLNGKEISQMSEDDLALLRREEIGFIFQQFNLLPRMSALENVSLPILYSKSPGGAERALSLLQRVGLATRIDHHPNALSGGQQQRVAIARALVNQPRIILADEPTGNLDSKSEKEILATLQELNSQGITVIMVTHSEEIAARANRVIRVRDGKIQSDEKKSTTLVAVDGQPGRSVSPPPKLGLKEIREHFRQGFKVLTANKVRTALSMLGILIGVAAVVAMLALGRGAQKSIESQLASLGSNLLTLQAGALRMGGVLQVGGSVRLSNDDVTAIQNRISLVKSVSGAINGRVQVTYQNKNWNTMIRGTSGSYAAMRAAQPEVGHFFSEEDNRKRLRVAVVGMTVVRELFDTKNPMGEMIKLNKVPFQIVGILPEKGSNGWQDQDDIIIIPNYTAMFRLLGRDYLDWIDIEIIDAASVDRAQEMILELMLSRRHIPVSQQDQSFQIRNMADIQAALSQTSKTMSMLLATIAAISLLVGGIGIMNIMLVSVTERTREIGLRKAIGARRGDILMQFLAESIVISSFGGLAGIVLGWGITTSLSFFTGWATSVSVSSVLVSFFFSALIGIVFGIYPARKASLLHPIDALRHE